MRRKRRKTQEIPVKQLTFLRFKSGDPFKSPLERLSIARRRTVIEEIDAADDLTIVVEVPAD